MQTDNLVSSLQTDLLKSSGTFCILVGVTGSVAALKLPVLVSQLLQLPSVSSFTLVKLVLTKIYAARCCVIIIMQIHGTTNPFS